jgi:hypothetical protein
VGSITSEDQKQIMEGFESYMENKHNDNNNNNNNNNNSAPSGSTTTASIGANNNTSSTSTSTKKGLYGSMSSSYSTNRYGNRFDPDFQTLEGVRKNLHEKFINEE